MKENSTWQYILHSEDLPTSEPNAGHVTRKIGPLYFTIFSQFFWARWFEKYLLKLNNLYLQLREQRDRAEKDLKEEKDLHDREITDFKMKIHTLESELEKLQMRLDKALTEKDKLEVKLEFSQTELGKLKKI